jgi:hypothetical protein
MSDNLAAPLFKNLKNEHLLKTLATLHRHPDNQRVQDALFNRIIGDTLIVLSGSPIKRRDDSALCFDSDNMATYEVGCEIALVSLNTPEEISFVPAFTDTASLLSASIDPSLHAVAMPGYQALEMFLFSTSEFIVFNPGLPLMFEFDRKFATKLIADYRQRGDIPDSPGVELR